VGLWSCKSKARKRCPKTIEQRNKPRWGYKGQAAEAASKEKHHKDEEGHGKMV